MEIVPQQQVQEGGLAVSVVPQRGRPEPGVQEAAGKGGNVAGRRKAAALALWDAGPSLPPDHVEFVQELIDAGVVVITFCHHQVKGPAVLGADLLHQVIRHLLSLQEGNRAQGGGSDALKSREAARAVGLSPGLPPDTAGTKGNTLMRVPGVLQTLPGAVAPHKELSSQAGNSGDLTSGYRLLFIR